MCAFLFVSFFQKENKFFGVERLAFASFSKRSRYKKKKFYSLK